MKPEPSIQLSAEDSVQLSAENFDKIAKMGVYIFSLVGTNLSMSTLIQLCFEAGERSGREKLRKEIRTVLGIV